MKTMRISKEVYYVNLTKHNIGNTLARCFNKPNFIIGDDSQKDIIIEYSSLTKAGKSLVYMHGNLENLCNGLVRNRMVVSGHPDIDREAVCNFIYGSNKKLTEDTLILPIATTSDVYNIGNPSIITAKSIKKMEKYLKKHYKNRSAIFIHNGLDPCCSLFFSIHLTRDEATDLKETIFFHKLRDNPASVNEQILELVKKDKPIKGIE